MLLLPAKNPHLSSAVIASMNQEFQSKRLRPLQQNIVNDATETGQIFHIDLKRNQSDVVLLFLPDKISVQPA